MRIANGKEPSYKGLETPAATFHVSSMRNNEYSILYIGTIVWSLQREWRKSNSWIMVQLCDLLFNGGSSHSHRGVEYCIEVCKCNKAEFNNVTSAQMCIVYFVSGKCDLGTLLHRWTRANHAHWQLQFFFVNGQNVISLHRTGHNWCFVDCCYCGIFFLIGPSVIRIEIKINWSLILLAFWVEFNSSSGFFSSQNKWMKNIALLHSTWLRINNDTFTHNHYISVLFWYSSGDICESFCHKRQNYHLQGRLTDSQRKSRIDDA